ncbi:ferritin-like domain-containing protein [Aromatoleum petrolei]|uniref:Rubrerythrin n=1 Tax=Aromatoleum petrolei TaxID=76116 RepID=A0ABX1MRI2_9RHOO|nr:ferritin family protein [Aromatoleum petrolei]NMF88599.1 rubrerythrin [Aromatoleum petrolei]QTQ34693.1 Ferritin-like superfamily protein [Aromatoleum petrolei]
MSGKQKPNRSLEELFEYAMAMEREAARRYTQLSDMMAQHNNPEMADFFRRMADVEWLHVYNVGEIRREVGVPENIGKAKPGLGLDGAEVLDVLDIHYLQHPYHALTLARQHEERAVSFYTDLAGSAENEEVRAMARRFAGDEEAHVRELDRWLAHYPKPEEGWDDDPDPPNELE